MDRTKGMSRQLFYMHITKISDICTLFAKRTYIKVKDRGDSKKDFHYMQYYKCRFGIETIKKQWYFNSWAYSLNFDVLDSIWVKTKVRNKAGNIIYNLFSSKDEEKLFYKCKKIEKVLNEEQRILRYIINDYKYENCDCSFKGHDAASIRQCESAVKSGECPRLKFSTNYIKIKCDNR